MGLYYNPPQPQIGAAQPLEPRKLTPPSGPPRQDPPFNGGARIAQQILLSWAVPAAALVLPQLLVPASPAQANVPTARTPEAIYQAWNVAPAPFAALRLLTPPISAPAADNPSFSGGARVPVSALLWWQLSPPLPQLPTQFVPPPPIVATYVPPAIGGGAAILQWWSAAAPSQLLQQRFLTPPQSGPDLPPFIGAVIPAALHQWWRPTEAAPQLPPGRLLVSAPISFVPPPIGVGAVIAQWWSATQSSQPLPRFLTPPQSGSDLPPFVGAIIPVAIHQWWWRPTEAASQLPRLLVSAPVSFVPPSLGVPVAVSNWWAPARQQFLPPRALTPPQSGPVAQNPPFAGGAVIAAAVLRWWTEPGPVRISPFNAMTPVRAVYSASVTIGVYSGTVSVGYYGGGVTIHEV